MTIADQIAAAMKHLPASSDQKEVRRLIGQFNHNVGLYKFHDLTKEDKKLAASVRLATQKLINLIHGGKISPTKVKLAKRMPESALSALKELSESIETEQLSGRGNVDRTDRKLAIVCAAQLLSPDIGPSDVTIARLAADLNCEPKKHLNYLPLVREAKKRGLI